MSETWLAAAGVGFVAGYLSGQFGIGGGMITTPAIRLILGGSELVAVGTPLPVIIPTAITGVIEYRRRGLLDTRVGLTLGAVGAAFSVLGAWLTSLVGGDVVLYLTAALIAWMSFDMAQLALRPEQAAHVKAAMAGRRDSWLWLAAIGAITGVYSGFLGLGGGFVVVPALVRFLGFDAKRAVGTSLIAVLILAVPGTITHYLLGHIDIAIALGMSLGVVPGAMLGARVTAASQEKTVRVAFAAMLLVVGLLLAANELGWLSS
ncbi:sulfite exporter TauE/SafE family protein [Anaerosoma tenue]|uniref:sulfite exporter TauE/SafE family protein n=1 Tax=Anaerosoma tenue TaxID=2933588 RepID=UPI00226083FC|nr:sulfite exporter TauE/SafE family protein [Anaerosoma tenue]MCK8115845.1 sulfite exporter TauE/SafE family protein [Anaerosoma tenue]